jgi:alpha-tubulin suppressor-like RCC1 family protein
MTLSRSAWSTLLCLLLPSSALACSQAEFTTACESQPAGCAPVTDSGSEEVAVTDALGDSAADAPEACPVGSCRSVTDLSRTLSATTCALLSDSTVRCWGRNASGQIGDGTTDDRAHPVEITALRGARRVVIGDDHACAVLGDASAVCGGKNEHGQLGDGTTTSRKTPAPVSVISDVQDLALSAKSTCALLLSKKVYCWGAGELAGNGSVAPSTKPVEVIGLAAVTEIAATEDVVCARQSSGDTKCWGTNGAATAGVGDNLPRTTPTKIEGAYSQLATGGGAVCAVRFGDGANCWGDGSFKQFGYATTGYVVAPAAATAFPVVKQVYVGGGFVCGAGIDGIVSCAGANDSGQLGDGSNIDHSTAAPVKGLGAVTVFRAGIAHACAIVGSDVRCWGANGSGQLGDGTYTDRNAPVAVSW